MVGFGLLCFGYVSTETVSLVREYFGRTNFGTIFGLIIGVGALGSIIGPTIAGWVYDSWGSYQAIWLVFAGLAVAAVIAVLTIRPLVKRS